MCKKSRVYCKKEKGFVGKLQNPHYFKHLSVEALAWESDLTAIRLKGIQLHVFKNISGCIYHRTTEEYEHDEQHNKCGYGGYVCANGHKLQGVFKDNVRNGYSKFALSSNQIYFQLRARVQLMEPSKEKPKRANSMEKQLFIGKKLT